MRRDKVRTDYTNVKDSELAILAGKIAGFMEGNTNFSADIKPTAAELLAAAEDYRIKHEVAINGGSSHEKELKKAAKLKLRGMLTHLAHMVNIEAQGNTVALSSTGLMFNKQPTALQEPGITDRIILRDGRLTGQMRVDFDKIYNAYEYEVQVGEMDSISEKIVWDKTHLTPSSSNTIIAPLTPGTRYYVRVRGRNKIGTGDWSDPVSMIVR
ncbi:MULTISPECIES: fibronectin type III domain-containing protein [Sphingobacterium]|uniref:fibronectin type III domain-containing protein n=1 Tax=Sphingobacterium TaxID=28453 RepID=UPI0013DB291B|nr:MULTISPECIES: fibronectin type III domain-containing protein [unclassified Sphingobacterium]